MTHTEHGGEAAKAARDSRRRATRRIVLAPARAFVRSSYVGQAVRSGVGGVTASAAGVLETEGEKAVDSVLASPLPEAVTRLLIERRVVERVVAEFLVSGELERMVTSAAEDERTEQLVQRVLASPAVQRMLIDAVESRLVVELSDRLLGSPEFQRVVTDAVRGAVASQSATLADTMAAGARRLDSRVEAAPRRWVGRPSHPPGEAIGAPVPYAGLGSHVAALVVDAVALHVIFLVGCAMVGLVVTVTRHRLWSGWRGSGSRRLARPCCRLLHDLLVGCRPDPRNESVATAPHRHERPFAGNRQVTAAPGRRSSGDQHLLHRLPARAGGRSTPSAPGLPCRHGRHLRPQLESRGVGSTNPDGMQACPSGTGVPPDPLSGDRTAYADMPAC